MLSVCQFFLLLATIILLVRPSASYTRKDRLRAIHELTQKIDQNLSDDKIVAKIGSWQRDQLINLLNKVKQNQQHNQYQNRKLTKGADCKQQQQLQNKANNKNSHSKHLKSLVGYGQKLMHPLYVINNMIQQRRHKNNVQRAMEEIENGRWRIE